jgi:hypothetical protein
MSSDTFRVKVIAVEGRDVLLGLKPSTAAGLCDLARTRSFVLMQLHRHGGPVTFEQTLDVEWLKQHLDEYVSAVRIEKLQGLTYEPLLRQIARDFQIPIDHLQPRITLRATMASEALAAFFPEGESEGTTSFDVWLDPLAAEVPSQVEDAPPYDPRSDPVGDIKAAVPSLMPRWKSDFLGFERAGADATIHVRFDSSSFALRPGFTVHVVLLVPAFASHGGKKRGEAPSSLVLSGQVSPRATPYWFRQYEGASDEPQEIATFADEVALEDLSSPHERFARTMDDPAVDELLTREGLMGLFEDTLAARPPKELPPNYARLGQARAPVLLGRWQWHWKPELLWQRIVLHAALGRREDARAALAQARARSKRPPKELKILIAALDVET